MKNKTTNKSKKPNEKNNTNHHANPSRASAEIKALGKNDKKVQKGSEHHNEQNKDKKTNIQQLHQNGSTGSDRM